MLFFSAVAGLFGADQLWTTAACLLFVGSVLTLFSGPNTATEKDGARPRFSLKLFRR